jgi:hypothetical protein
MTPYCTWNVEAASTKEAIRKVEMPQEFDMADEHMLVAVEEDEDFYEKTWEMRGGEVDGKIEGMGDAKQDEV